MFHHSLQYFPDLNMLYYEFLYYTPTLVMHYVVFITLKLEITLYHNNINTVYS